MAAGIVNIHGSTWKFEDIQDEIDWSKSQDWQYTKFQKKDDHAHCRICWWAIEVSDNPETGAGYTKSGNHWLCSECYKKFIQSGA